MQEDVTQDEDFVWNDGYVLEGMDRCHTIMVMMEELLVNHPSILRSEQSEEVDKVISDVMDIYQKIGLMDEE